MRQPRRRHPGRDAVPLEHLRLDHARDLRQRGQRLINAIGRLPGGVWQPHAVSTRHFQRHFVGQFSRAVRQDRSRFQWVARRAPEEADTLRREEE